MAAARLTLIDHSRMFMTLQRHTSSAQPKWLIGMLLVAFVFAQISAHAHALEHVIEPASEHQENSCSACSASDQTPAISSALQHDLASTAVARTTFTAPDAQTPSTDSYYARAPPST